MIYKLIKDNKIISECFFFEELYDSIVSNTNEKIEFEEFLELYGQNKLKDLLLVHKIELFEELEEDVQHKKIYSFEITKKKL